MADTNDYPKNGAFRGEMDDLEAQEKERWKKRYTQVAVDLSEICAKIEEFMDTLPPTPVLVLAASLRVVADGMFTRATMQHHDNMKEQVNSAAIKQMLEAAALANAGHKESGHG